MSNDLRKFGFNLGLGLNILGCILFYRHKAHFMWFSSIGSFALILAILYPKALRPLEKILTAIIHAFSWLVTTISLLFAFYLIFTPIGLLLRLFGEDLLRQKIDSKTDSYWNKRRGGIFSKKSYEQMG